MRHCAGLFLARPTRVLPPACRLFHSPPCRHLGCLPPQKTKQNKNTPPRPRPHHDVYVESVPDENGMLLNLDLDEKIAWPRRARLALAPHSDAHAGVDSRRDLNVDAARAVGTPPGNGLGAAGGHFFQVEAHRRLTPFFGGGEGSDTGSSGEGGCSERKGGGQQDAERAKGQGQLGGGARKPASAPLRQQVVKIHLVGVAAAELPLEAARTGSEAALAEAARPAPTVAGPAVDTRVPEGVVRLALLGVAQHLVCLRRLSKLLGRLRVALVRVRVVRLRLLVVLALNLAVARRLWQPKHLVQVPARRRPCRVQSARAPDASRQANCGRAGPVPPHQPRQRQRSCTLQQQPAREHARVAALPGTPRLREGHVCAALEDSRISFFVSDASQRVCRRGVAPPRRIRARGRTSSP
eukprot:scaffold5440_cov88-Isochrysis_galbana.AAC.8